jgi:phage baseplate assembly protein W
MASSSRLYDKITLKGKSASQIVSGSKTYKGFSTVSTLADSFALYDLQLIKQDILNHFHIRLGERLEQPTFGTVIWDILFEPLTEEVKNLITKDVETIINYDSRVRAEQILVTSYDTGIQIECVLVYYPYNIQEAIQLKFDKANGLSGM